MRWILFLLSALAFLVGLGTTVSATTIFQEMTGLIAFVIWAVLFCGAACVDAIVNLTNELRKLTREAEKRERTRKDIAEQSRA